jgi:hypothetical protein
MPSIKLPRITGGKAAPRSGSGKNDGGAKKDSSGKKDGGAKKEGGGKNGSPKSGGSSIANTPSRHYRDTAAFKKNCQKELKEIEEKCKPESDEAKEKRRKGKGGLLGKLKPPAMTKGGKPGSEWIGDHCEFLMFKPRSANDMFDELKGLPDQLAEQLGMKALEALERKAEEVLMNAVKSKLKKIAVKQALVRVGAFLGGPVVGIAVNIAMTADGARDVMKAMNEFPEYKQKLEDAKKAVEQASKQVKDLKELRDRYIDPKTGELNKDALVSDTMEGAARMNPCVTARRCNLVPYRRTENPEALNGKGCCPGQTGHHVLPSAMFAHCSNYTDAKKDNAPTVCVEGATNTHGSHGKMHRSLKAIQDDRKSVPTGGTMSKADAIDDGVESVQRTFPEAKCSEKCLKAQLESFYQKLNCKPKKESGLPGGGAATNDGKI